MFESLSPNNPLIILEMANNHNGSLEHGRTLIKEAKSVVSKFNFKCAIKFQYRDLDTFIHEEYRERLDIRYVKRFIETKLSWDQLFELKEFARENGFLTACTPFDEYSVDMVLKHNFDIIKVASASFSDWPLLEKIVIPEKPIILSTAASELSTIDRVFTFLKNRDKEFAFMHCVAEYPTKNSNLILNRIEKLKSRYSNIQIGYSTHEDPTNQYAGIIAVSKGASILEKHFGSSSNNQEINGYSANKENLKQWMSNLSSAIEMLGSDLQINSINKSEQESLSQLKRYVFSKRFLKKGEELSAENTYYATPGQNDGLTTHELGKYQVYVLNRDLDKNRLVLRKDLDCRNFEEQIFEARNKVIDLIKKSGVPIPQNSTLEISHHYGIEKFDQFGVSMLTIVNREYCKKLLISLPGQVHPNVMHKSKDETFILLYGDAEISLNKEKIKVKIGDAIQILPGNYHGYSTINGCIIEEISTTHKPNDSFYEDDAINLNQNRKTHIRFWI